MFFQRYCWGFLYLREERSRKEHRSYSLVALQSRNSRTQYKSTWEIADVETEVELILARASMFTLPKNVAQLTICPYRRSSLGIGWRRGSQRCQIPRNLSNHSHDRKWPKGERGLGKLRSKFVYQKTGVFVPVGSGMHR